MNILTPCPRTPLLDLDVLSTICPFVTEYPDLLSLSLTCSALRPLAIRSLLRNQPVVLNDATAVCKFHYFVFADAPSRLRHLIALEIDVARDEIDPPAYGEPPFDSILALLRGASSLRSLKLWFNGHGWPLAYIGDSRIAAAVSALTTLRKLTVRGRNEWVELTSSLPSSLKTFTMEYVYPVGSEEWTPALLTAAFAHVAARLESLTINESGLQLAAGPESFSLPTPFRALRSISLWSTSDIPNLATLLELFPNLDGTLRLFLDRSVSEDTPEQRRVLLESHQRHFGVQERRRWRQLEKLVTDVGILFALNLRCNIGMMMIHSCSPPTTGFLVSSLRLNPPTRLHLQIDLTRGIEKFCHMIPREAAMILTHLTLCVCYDDCDIPIPHGTSMLWNNFWYDNLLPTLRPMYGLTHLHLAFHGTVWYRELENELEGSQGEETSQDTFVWRLQQPTFNFVGLASAVMFVLPSLQYCFFTTSIATLKVLSVSNTFSTHRVEAVEVDYWGGRISTSNEGGREFTWLPDDIAESIIEDEELGLSEFEEREMFWDSSE